MLKKFCDEFLKSRYRHFLTLSPTNDPKSFGKLKLTLSPLLSRNLRTCKKFKVFCSSNCNLRYLQGIITVYLIIFFSGALGERSKNIISYYLLENLFALHSLIFILRFVHLKNRMVIFFSCKLLMRYLFL